jgi:hypothetical protein
MMRASTFWVHTHQDDTAISARAFDRRAKGFQHCGALSTASIASGAGVTLSVFCGKAGIPGHQHRIGGKLCFQRVKLFSDRVIGELCGRLGDEIDQAAW